MQTEVPAIDPEAESETPSTIENEAMGVFSAESDEYEDKGGSLFIEFREGNADAFTKLIVLYQPKIFRKVLAMVGDLHTAEDLMQDIWLKLSQDTSYNHDEKFYAWFTVLVRNAIFDYFRLRSTKNLRLTRVFSTFEDDQESVTPMAIAPDNPTIGIEQREEVVALLSILPEKYRRTLQLYYFDDLSIDEIAEIELVTPSAIDHRLATARHAVRSKCVLMTH